MSIDFPRAWQICKAAPDSEHNPKCSWVTHRLLCDCHIINKHPEYLDDILQGRDSVPCKIQCDIKKFDDHAFRLFEKLKDFYAQPLDGCWPLRPKWVPDLNRPPKHVYREALTDTMGHYRKERITSFRRFTFEEFLQILEMRKNENFILSRPTIGK